MKRHFLMTLALVACAMGALAQSFPTVSTAERTVWYLIQFANGGNAITASAEAAMDEGFLELKSKVLLTMFSGSQACSGKAQGLQERVTPCLWEF